MPSRRATPRPDARCRSAASQQLTTAGAVELIKACGQITAALTQAGVIRQSEANVAPAGKLS